MLGLTPEDEAAHELWMLKGIGADREFHPCEQSGCNNVVPYDDEPFCFADSPDSGSYVSGYSYKARHPQA